MVIFIFRGGVIMQKVFDTRHLFPAAHHRFWLVVAGLIAFLLAALWTQPSL